MKYLSISLSMLFLNCFLWGSSSKMVQIKVDEVIDGSITIEPPLPENGKVSPGTELKIYATANSGFSLDSIYYSHHSRIGWLCFFESAHSPYTLKVERDISVGASFIENSALEGFKVIHNINYAKPGVKQLKYDVYQPETAQNLPCIIIIHGGGWTHNNEDIMRGLARELVRSGEYVVFSVDYRWNRKFDGDEEPNTVVDLIEDVFGAIVHIQEHSHLYGADPKRIAVTGDSAGGHLSASVANMCNRIGNGGFGVKPNVFEYLPTYMPKDKSIDQVRREVVEAIQVAAPSYGVYGGKMMTNHANGESIEWERAISPIHCIPDAKERLLPQFILRGSKDRLIKPELVQSYISALKEKGQPVQYIEVKGAGHPFLDWKPDPKTKETFKKHAVPHIKMMKAFFDQTFYPEK